MCDCRFTLKIEIWAAQISLDICPTGDLLKLIVLVYGTLQPKNTSVAIQGSLSQ